MDSFSDLQIIFCQKMTKIIIVVFILIFKLVFHLYVNGIAALIRLKHAHKTERKVCSQFIIIIYDLKADMSIPELTVYGIMLY